MYCKYCGTELADEAKFCTKCGKSTDEDFLVEEVSQETEKTLSKPNRLLKVILSIIAILLIAIIVLIVKTKMSNTLSDKSDTSGTVESVAEADLEEEKNKSDNIVKNVEETVESDNVKEVSSTENSLQLMMILSYSKDGLTPYKISVAFDSNMGEVNVTDVIELDETLVNDKSVPDDCKYVISETFAKFYRDYLQSEQEKIDVRYLDACEYYAQIGENGYVVAMDCFPAEFKLECDGKDIVFHTIDSVISASNARSVRESEEELGKAVYTNPDSQDGGAIVCEMKIVANIESDNMDEFNSFISDVVGGSKVNEDATTSEETDNGADDTNAFNGTWSQIGDESYVFTLEDGTGHLHSDFSDDCDVTYTYDGKVFYMETNFGTVEYYYYPDKDLLCRDADGAEFYRQ